MLNSTNLPLDKKKIIKKTLEKFSVLLLSLIFGGIMVALGLLLPDLKLWWLPIIGIALPVLSIVGVYAYQTYYYKLYYYDFKDDSAEIKKGVISQSTGHVRYERIQNIFIDQDILDRIFGLYDVHYETAGETSGIYSHVDGLNKENSDKLVEFLNDKLFNGSRKTEQNIPESTSIPSAENSKATGEIIDRNATPISSRIVIKDTITTSLLFILFIFAFFGRLTGFGEMKISEDKAIVIYLLFVALAIIGSFIYCKVWFNNFYFQFSDNSGIIKSQVISLSSSYIYYDRIQNINVTQGVLERIFGLYSVTVETAAESSAKNKKGGLKIPGLSKLDAEKIKNFLLAKVDIYKNKL